MKRNAHGGLRKIRTRRSTGRWMRRHRRDQERAGLRKAYREAQAYVREHGTGESRSRVTPRAAVRQSRAAMRLSRATFVAWRMRLMGRGE